MDTFLNKLHEMKPLLNVIHLLIASFFLYIGYTIYQGNLNEKMLKTVLVGFAVGMIVVHGYRVYRAIVPKKY